MIELILTALLSVTPAAELKAQGFRVIQERADGGLVWSRIMPTTQTCASCGMPQTQSGHG